MGKGRPSMKSFKKNQKGGGDDDEGYEPPSMVQNANAGMMPPSDSEEEEDEAPPPKAKPAGQNPNAGMLPPSDSESEEGEEDAKNAPATKSAPVGEPKVITRPAVFVEKSEKEVAADMEKLAIVRKRREEQAAARIAKEGYDRFSNDGKPNIRDSKAPVE